MLEKLLEDLRPKGELNCPKVSVIVPVYNNEDKIGLLIESLMDQDYPKDRYEIRVVDNGSNDKSKEIIQRYPVVFLEENEIQSSYAARNKGLRYARGDILAFIDSDCIADAQWLKEGVNALTKADLAGGKVEFFFSDQKTTAEIFDSIMNMQNHVMVKEQGASVTANLFVKANIFKKLGIFAPVKSGEDFQWTYAATQHGYKINFADKAIVRHPTRKLYELLRKSLRVGSGYPNLWGKLNKPVSYRFETIVRTFLPQKFSTVRRIIRERAPDKDYEKQLKSIWAISYLCSVATGLGILASWLNSQHIDYEQGDSDFDLASVQ